MILSLKNLSDIQFGYQQRGQQFSSHKSLDGSHAIIQIKDIATDGAICHDHFSRITPSGNPNRYLINEGNVLFLSRGVRNIAIPVQIPLEKTIASYYFYVLRVQREDVLPEYLAWFINQPVTQATLAIRQHGSLLKMVPKKAFEELEINLPSLETQKIILKLEQLRRKEKQTMHHLVEARKRLIDGVGLQTARNGATNY